MTFEQLVARLAGGFAQPVDNESLRAAIQEALPVTPLGELDSIKLLPGMVDAAADTLHKAWRAAIDRISPEVRNNKLTFFAIATGAADEAKLGEIASPARVKRLSGQSWDALFAWIAQSADAVAKSDGTTQRVTYPSTDPWAGQNATPQ